MIRAVAQGKDGPLILLGITEENIHRLKQGRPIHIALGRLLRQAARETEGLGHRTADASLGLAIFYGETHHDAVAMLQEYGIRLPKGAAEEADAIDASLRDG